MRKNAQALFHHLKIKRQLVFSV